MYASRGLICRENNATRSTWNINPNSQVHCLFSSKPTRFRVRQVESAGTNHPSLITANCTNRFTRYLLCIAQCINHFTSWVLEFFEILWRSNDKIYSFFEETETSYMNQMNETTFLISKILFFVSVVNPQIQYRIQHLSENITSTHNVIWSIFFIPISMYTQNIGIKW